MGDPDSTGSGEHDSKTIRREYRQRETRNGGYERVSVTDNPRMGNSMHLGSVNLIERRPIGVDTQLNADLATCIEI